MYASKRYRPTGHNKDYCTRRNAMWCCRVTASAGFTTVGRVVIPVAGIEVVLPSGDGIGNTIVTGDAMGVGSSTEFDDASAERIGD